MKVFASIVIYKHSYEELKPTLDSLLNTNSIQKIILVDNDASNWAGSFSHEKIVYIKTAGVLVMVIILQYNNMQQKVIFS